MKILVYGLNYSPEKIGIGKYTGELAVWLASRGHEVRVVTAPPYYPEWQVQLPYKSYRWVQEQIDGVTVFRCPLWVPRKPSGLTRILHLFSFAFSSCFTIIRQIKWKPDIIFCVAPTLFCAPVAHWAARRSKAISWLHIQDFELDAASNLGMLGSGNLFLKIASAWERANLIRFDRVSSISQKMTEKLVQKGVAPDRVVLFPNWVDKDTIHPVTSSENPFRQELGIDKKTILVLYSGNMGMKQGLDLIIRCAEKTKDNPSVHYLLCGNGAARASLENQAQDLKNVTFLDLQPIEKLNDLLNSADVHLLPQQANAADLVMPSKLLGILASGKPVIATASPDTELGLVVSQVGVLIPPGSVEEAVNSIQQLAESSQLRDELGQKGREYVVEHWNTEHVLQEFEQQIIHCKSDKKIIELDNNPLTN